MKIHGKHQPAAQPVSEAKEQRMDEVQEALDERSVNLAKLSKEDIAANRSYGAKMVGDIDEVQSQAPSGEKAEESGSGRAPGPMEELFGYGPGGMPGMGGDYNSMMMMLLIQQHMMIMMMMAILLQGGPIMPMPFPGLDNIPVDEIEGGGEGTGDAGEVSEGEGTTEETEASDEASETDSETKPNKSDKMTPVKASTILQHYFDLVDTAAGIGKKDGIIGKADLEAVAKNPDAPKDLKDAVAYILRNPMVLNAIDVGAGQGRVDGKIGKADLETFIKDHTGKEGYDTAPADEAPTETEPDSEPETESVTEEESAPPFDPERHPTVTPEVKPTPEVNATVLKAQAAATRIHQAVSGAGTDEKTLSGALSGQTKEEMEAVKAAYAEMYGRTLEQVVRSETSGDLQTLLLALLKGRASESAPVDKGQVNADVKSLHKAISGVGTDENTILTILASRSKKHLAEVSRGYENAYGEKLSEAIKGDTSGAFETALLQNLA